jgi:hypothetical protein
VEFGLPLDITLMRGRSNDVSVFVERLFTENMATYLGHDAYLRETDLMWHLNRDDFDDPAGENFRKSNLPRDVWPVGGYQHWFITRDKMGGLGLRLRALPGLHDAVRAQYLPQLADVGQHQPAHAVGVPGRDEVCGRQG